MRVERKTDKDPNLIHMRFVIGQTFDYGTNEWVYLQGKQAGYGVMYRQNLTDPPTESELRDMRMLVPVNLKSERRIEWLKLDGNWRNDKELPAIRKAFEYHQYFRTNQTLKDSVLAKDEVQSIKPLVQWFWLKCQNAVDLKQGCDITDPLNPVYYGTYEYEQTLNELLPSLLPDLYK